MYQVDAVDAVDGTAADATANFTRPGGEAPAAGEHRLVIESRFGTLAIGPQNALEFPRGLLGFGDLHSYALADLADPRLPQFMVLQCLDDHQLSFLVLPLDPESGVIAAADLAASREALSIAAEDLAVVLVVTVHKTAEGVLVSANLRAPLLLDTASRIGVQHVLSSDRYPVRYPLTETGS